jgi:hypothetical protein
MLLQWNIKFILTCNKAAIDNEGWSCQDTILKGDHPSQVWLTYVQGFKKEWVSDSWHQMSNFSALSWREQVTFWWDDYDFLFVVDQHTESDFYSATSLKQQSVYRHVTPRDTLLWIHGNHSLLLPLNAACSTQKQQIPILKSLVWPDWGLSPRSTTLK